MRRTAIRPPADTTTACERFVFWGLVALLFWAPLPLGSYRPWAVAVIVIWVAALGVVWSVGWALGHCTVNDSFYRGRLALALLVAWAALVSLQLAPLPADWVALVSPGVAAVYANGYEGAVASGLAGSPASAVASSLPRAIFLTVDAAATAEYQLLTLALVAYFALMLLVIQRTERLKQFALMVVASGLTCSVLALYLHFTGANYSLFFEQINHEVAKGPFHNRNHLAAYLEICLACGAGLIAADFAPAQLTTWKQRTRWLLSLLLSPKARVRLLLIVMVIALILTRSRMGNAAFLMALIAGGFIALMSLRTGWKTIVLFLVSMIILDAVVIGSWIGVEQVVKRMQQTALTSDTKQTQGLLEESVEERTDQGLSSLASVSVAPLFGTGAGSFEGMYPQYKQPGYKLTLNHAHIDYVEFLVESGVLGTAPLLGLVLMALIASLRTLRNSKRAEKRGLALGTLIGIISVMIHATVEFAFQIPAVAFSFVALLAVVFLAQDRSS